MAYVKPGVEITQVQRTFSPTLISPDLPAAIVGPAYKLVPAEGDGSYSYPKYTAGMLVTLSGLQSYLKLDASSLYVDLLMTSGVNSGNRLHVSSVSGATDGGTTFTISSGVADSSWNGASVLVGYRALSNDPQIDGFITIEKLEDIDNRFGGNQVAIDNPLVFATYLAMSNTLTTVNAICLRADEFDLGALSISGTGATENTRAMDVLGAQEVYAIAPFSKDDTILSNWRAHVNNASVPTEKHERIAVLNSAITWKDSNGATITDPTAADKAATARGIKDTNSAIQMKRVFQTFPDTVYFKENGRHVAKIKSSYINSLYSQTNPYCVLANTYQLASGAYYKAGTIVTDTIWTALNADTTFYKYDVYVPVPGAFMAACIAGQISGQFPEQGHTNLPIAGPSKLKYSNDFFTESQLNTMAAGGTYIMTNVGGVVACRHQLSTDMTSIERREMNITKSVDFTAKFIRNTVVGYIGRSLITPAFLQVLGSIISGLGTTLVKSGRLNGFKVTGIKQDEVERDTVRVSIEIQPKYPVNYIKVDLIF